MFAPIRDSSGELQLFLNVDHLDAGDFKTVLPELDGMIGGGLITLERAKVIMYRPHLPDEERPASWPIDITGSWRVVDDDPGPTDA